MPQIGVYMSKKLYKIGELAELYGISTDIIRHYDKIGLLKPNIIRENGYRHYSIDQVFELELILNLRSVDMSLDDIKNVMHKESKNSNMKNILLSQSHALKERIEKLQSMLEKTETYISYVDPSNTALNKWNTGTRPSIHAIDEMFSTASLPSLESFRDKTRHMNKDWYHILNFFVRSPLSVVNDPESFDSVSSFTYGSYKTLDFPNTIELPKSKALCCTFHGKESEFESMYESARVYMLKNNQTPKNYIYALDAFGWKEGNDIFIRSDLYIDLVEN